MILKFMQHMFKSTGLELWVTILLIKCLDYSTD